MHPVKSNSDDPHKIAKGLKATKECQTRAIDCSDTYSLKSIKTFTFYFAFT